MSNFRQRAHSKDLTGTRADFFSKGGGSLLVLLIFFEIDALPHMRAPRLFEIDAVPNIQDPRDMCFWTLAFFSSIGGLPPTTTTLFSKPFPHTFAHSFHFLHNQSQSRTVVHCDHAFGVHAAFRTQEQHQAATTP